MPALLLTRESRWVCPNCDFTDVTFETQPHSRMHNCAGLAGISVPMVPEGTVCKIETVERQDMIAGEQVQLDANGRPIMAAITTREDGQDCTVYAPCATGSREDL